MKTLFYCAVALLLMISCEKDDDDDQTSPLNLKAELLDSPSIPLSSANAYELFIRNEEIIGASTSGGFNWDFLSAPKLFTLADAQPQDVKGISDAALDHKVIYDFLVSSDWAILSGSYDELFVFNLKNNASPANAIPLDNHKQEYMTLTQNLPVIALNEKKTGKLSVCLLASDGQSLDTIYTRTAISDYLPKLKLAHAFTDEGKQYIAMLIDNAYLNEKVREKSLVILDVASGNISFSKDFEVEDDVFILKQEGIVRNEKLFFFAGADIYNINLHNGTTEKHAVSIDPTFYFRQQMTPVDHRRVAFKSADGLAAFDLESGEVLWHRQFTDFKMLKSPVVYKDYILITTGERFSYKIGAIDINTGEYLGHIIHNNNEHDLTFNTSPVVLNNHLYLGSDEAIFRYALSPKR